MNRRDLIAHIREDGVYLTKKEATQIVDAFFNAITNRLAAGGRVELRGFGSFSTRQRDGYVGHHPRTLKREVVKPKRVAWFRTSETLAGQLLPPERVLGHEKADAR